MIGHVIMEIEADEMIAMVQFYLNHSVFHVEGCPSRECHRAYVTAVRQRSNGTFVIDFDGPMEGKVAATGAGDIS